MTISVLIPDGESEFALFVMHCLAPRHDVRIHVAGEARWPSTRLSRFCASYTRIPAKVDETSWLSIVSDIVRRRRIDVLLPVGPRGISATVRHREALASFVAVVPTPTAESLATADDKGRLATFLDGAGIATPPTLLVEVGPAFLAPAATMRYPVLVKPVFGWGGEGIERFETAIDLWNAFERRDPSTWSGAYVAQTVRVGPVIGINVLAIEGRLVAVTVQRGVIPNSQPYAAASAIRFFRDAAVEALAERLVGALRWSGVANVDTLRDDATGELEVLDVNARYWGSLRGSCVAGVSFPYLACLAAMGIEFDRPEYDLCDYVHGKAALRAGLRQLLGRGGRLDVRRSGLAFLAADPLAEGSRVLVQQLLG